MKGMNFYGSTPVRQCRAVRSLNRFERAFVHEGLFAPSLLSLCNAHGFSLTNATPFLMFFARSGAIISMSSPGQFKIDSPVKQA
jgi:hypothetical protein